MRYLKEEDVINAINNAYGDENIRGLNDVIRNISNEFDTETLKSFVLGEWVESEKVQEFLGLSFSECYRLFDIHRTAEWWSIVGKTDEERNREGQKVTCYFRLKRER